VPENAFVSDKKFCFGLNLLQVRLVSDVNGNMRVWCMHDVAGHNHLAACIILETC